MEGESDGGIKVGDGQRVRHNRSAEGKERAGGRGLGSEEDTQKAERARRQVVVN